MTPDTPPNRLDRPVDESYDHVLGPSDAEITLVEYGSYADPASRLAHERVAQMRSRFGNRLRYVFRHRPLTGSLIARQAAERVESVGDPARFWNMHVSLMALSDKLTEDDLHTMAASLDDEQGPGRNDLLLQAQARVDADVESAAASGVIITPTFFINNRRYDGPWDANSLSEAMLGSLGHVVHAAALDFAKWAPSTGILLLLATGIAIVLSNSPLGPDFNDFWEQRLGLAFGATEFNLSLRQWINDGLLVIFFLVVGLEIKREFTVGHLSNRQAAMLPIFAAIGGMVVPVLLYLILVPDGSTAESEGAWSRGWGVPMATDTAFAIALIVMMGRRVPIELRVFLTAAAIVDDIGAIIVVAVFYSGELHAVYLAAAAAIIALLALLNKGGVYRASPYVALGGALWVCVYASGIHATLSGIILALFIPTRPPPNLRALMMQADAILTAETQRGREVLRYGPSEPALEALDAIHDRLESPADRMLRHVAPRSSYVVLPLFALANAGVEVSTHVFSGHAPLIIGTTVALAIGKPLGFIAATAAAVRLSIATKPYGYSWRQLAGAGALAGIGFTMSLFIASEAFAIEADFAAVKIAIFAGSILSAVVGVAILWNARRDSDSH
ncbi:Na+/H+ antiporter NhaA [Nitrosovibrio tenuis]|uniref:Na(+)/H(+) antiporter NhaA n=1 Tax=Nitrosovibrio tenuis TaxID=1233 RepID=A0A1H7NI99_9PROT|nr:Na+/H+ antiporter NhaA [Nitrosovibrio tenuis]SEL23049.1 Na+:H+ antiporter, NhaA family [Nitrosovibrio tenuis]